MIDEATHRQISAANPSNSTWLGANAGSGKTRVLTDRVARLLLSGTPPQNILCLTYTKAAASEMQNRLFSRLGEWAMKPDGDLRLALSELGVGDGLTVETLAAARRLFASAVETPGGLKIQTIHAFCASLLRQFPLEAGISPQFTEMDERTLDSLSAEILDEMAEADPGTIDGLARYVGDAKFADLSKALLKNRTSFDPPATEAVLLRAFGLAETETEAGLLADVFDGGEPDLIADLIHHLAASDSKTDQGILKKLRLLGPAPWHLGDLRVLEGVFLTGSGSKQPYSAKEGKIPTKAVRAGIDPDTVEALDALMNRVEAAREKRISFEAVARNTVLHRFASEYLPRVEERKQWRGQLDFDDLILRARDLLTNPLVADWVLFKLDGGIDHILVDEAQDTSPVQWQVISLLAKEFTAGTGARDGVERTLFVVGDRKQSIYSFQGADPAEFARMKDLFQSGLAASGGLQDHELLHSFRSAPAILQLVDATFAEGNVPGVGDSTMHKAFKSDLPGRVDLWAPVEKQPKEEDDTPWFEPTDKISPKSEHARLAVAIAAEIRRLIDEKAPLPDEHGAARALNEGDILILVQRRSALFHEIIRACKEQKLEISGTDRLVLTENLAVRDILALLAFLALPEDDLSLATVLRSPLFGLSEDALFRVAHDRSGTLWEALRNHPDHTETSATLLSLTRRAEFLRPYDLIDRILTRHTGRENLLARLGPDCEEAIDALLGEALIYDQADIPSLTGFLEWMHGEDVEIKRQAESAGKRLRVMTVHGAKGLEAPLVILPDTAKRKASPVDPVTVLEDGIPVWAGAASDRPAAVQQAVDRAKNKQEEERARLLYVAMTRAQQWLWICAAGDVGSDQDSWYLTLQTGLEACLAQEHPSPTGPGSRLESGNWTPKSWTKPPVSSTRDPVLANWVTEMPPKPAGGPATISPSDLGGAKALPGDSGQDQATAMVEGTYLHLLLEHLPDLPEAAWQTAASTLLNLPEGETARILEHAISVLTEPDLRFLFGPNTLAEVGFCAQLPGIDRPIRGTIDRLVVSHNRVLVVDYKSNALVPETPDQVPEGILRQLGAYAFAIKEVYPRHEVEVAVLWTVRPKLMTLPLPLVEHALQRADLDAAPSAT